MSEEPLKRALRETHAELLRRIEDLSLVQPVGDALAGTIEPAALGVALVALAPRPAARRVLVPEVVGAEPAEAGVPRLALTGSAVLEPYAPAALPTGLLVDVYG